MISEENNIDLTPLNFSKKEIQMALKENRMLALQAHLPGICNYNCYYCYTKHLFKDYLNNQATFNLYKNFIEQGKKLGAKVISFPGLGEPFLIEWINKLLNYCFEIDIAVVLFTNGSLIETNLELLLKYKPALYVKLNSITNPTIMDDMCGKSGCSNSSLKGIELLLKNNYQSDQEHLIGVESTVLKENWSEMPKLYRWCRENNIIPLIELPMPYYSSQKMNNLTRKEEIDLFFELSNIDKEYGFNWIPKPPFAGTGCSFNLISLCMYPDGSIHPCSGINLQKPFGNIIYEKLQDIWNSDRVQERNKCALKIKNNDSFDSYGCRAYVYRKTGLFSNIDDRVNNYA